MKNWTNKKIIGIGLGLTVGFLLVELLNDPIDWIKPVITGVIATALLFVLKLIFANKSSN